jgi:hypothetical protein
MTTPNPETRIAEEALRGLLTLIGRITDVHKSESPVGLAVEKLGDRFNQTAIDVIRTNTARALADDFNRDAILHALPGLPVTQMVMADIMAGALKDLVSAANQSGESSPNVN